MTCSECGQARKTTHDLTDPDLHAFAVSVCWRCVFRRHKLWFAGMLADCARAGLRAAFRPMELK